MQSGSVSVLRKIAPPSIPVYRSSDLPKGQEWSAIRAFGDIGITGKLSSRGCLDFDPSVRFRNNGGQNYLVESKDGLPQISTFSDGSSLELFPIIDNPIDQMVGLHVGTVHRKKFVGLQDATVYTRIPASGNLNIGGGRPLVTGEREKNRAWTVFPNNCGERVKLRIKTGLVFGCNSLESDLDVSFALVWKKSEARYTSSFCGALLPREFNMLDDDYEIYNFTLPRSGFLSLGGREAWMRLAKDFRGDLVRVDITDIRNPTGGEAFIVGAEVVHDGRIVDGKKLSRIYEVAPDSPPDSFERGRLVNVFDNLTDNKIQRSDGKALGNCIISGQKTDVWGALDMGGYWGTFSDYPDASLEARVLGGQPGYVHFVRDRFGQEVWDYRGNPLVIDLTGESGLIKKQMNRLTDRFVLLSYGRILRSLVCIPKIIESGSIGLARKMCLARQKKLDQLPAIGRQKREIEEAILEMMDEVEGIERKRRAEEEWKKSAREGPTRFRLTGYFNEADHMTIFEQVDLLQKISQGDQAARTELIERNIWLVKEIVGIMTASRWDYYDEMVQAGIVRLCEMVDEYVSSFSGDFQNQNFENYVRGELVPFFQEFKEASSAWVYRRMRIGKKTKIV